MLTHCEPIARRAREAARGGAAAFALPEAARAVAWVAATALDPAVRAEAYAWPSAGAGYHALLRLCAAAVTSLDGQWQPFPPVYRDKVAGELEAMLALCPGVLVFPTTEELTPMQMVELRAYPVHPLGLVDSPAWTDGALAPPSEFFFHDLDHARFKVREDLRANGIEIPDAYQGGSTVDPATGRHRPILPFADGRIGDALWERAASRVALARHLLAVIAALGESPRARAAELLLFEVVHEKSFPLDPAVLTRELADEAHVVKLRHKVDRRFFPKPVAPAVVEALASASVALREALS